MDIRLKLMGELFTTQTALYVAMVVLMGIILSNLFNLSMNLHGYVGFIEDGMVDYIKWKDEMGSGTTRMERRSMENFFCRIALIQSLKLLMITMILFIPLIMVLAKRILNHLGDSCILFAVIGTIELIIIISSRFHLKDILTHPNQMDAWKRTVAYNVLTIILVAILMKSMS